MLSSNGGIYRNFEMSLKFEGCKIFCVFKMLMCLWSDCIGSFLTLYLYCWTFEYLYLVFLSHA